LKTAGLSDLIDSRLSAGTATAAFDVHENWRLGTVHVNKVSVPFTRKVNERAELLLTTTVTRTARLAAVRATFGESIDTASSVPFAAEVPDGAP